MRVWITGNGILFPHGNASTNRLVEIAKGFVSYKFSAKLVPFQRQKLPRKELVGSYKTIEYEYFESIIGKKLPFLLRVFQIFLIYWKAIKISELLRKENVSIIFCGTSSISTLLTLYLAARKTNVQFIYDIVEDPISSWRSRSINELSFKQIIRHFYSLAVIPIYYVIAWRLPDYLTCITEDLKEKLLYLKYSPDIIYVFPIVKYIETEFESKHVRKTDTVPLNKFIHSGSTYFSKDGLKEIIEAIRILEDKNIDIELYFYGGANKQNKRRLNKLIHVSKLEDRVFLKGRVSFDELFVAQRESLAQICFKPLNPQNRYNFATKIIDYLDAERPIILSNLPVYRSYFRDEYDSIITSKNTSHELASAMEYLYNNQEEADIIGINGKRTLINKLNSASHIMEMLKVFGIVNKHE